MHAFDVRHGGGHRPQGLGRQGEGYAVLAVIRFVEHGHRLVGKPANVTDELHGTFSDVHRNLNLFSQRKIMKMNDDLNIVSMILIRELNNNADSCCEVVLENKTVFPHG